MQNMSRSDRDVIRRSLDECEAEMRQEADELDARATAEPSEHNKKAALGARWTTYHLREIRERLEKKATEC
jgi:hypothetical protein